MEDFRSKIGPIRPHHRAELGIHRDLGEVLDVAEWLEDRPPLHLKPIGKIHVTDEAVGEGEPNAILAAMVDGVISQGAVMAVAQR